jgi:predicted metal-dependent peptidase
VSGGVIGVTFPQELQAARILLAKERPYLAAAAWALQPVPKPGLGTMAVDMYWRLYYDPGVLGRWSIDVMKGVLYHEICHLLRNHAERIKDLIPRLGNIAADAEINDDLVREGIKFPAQPVTPALIGQPENLLAEEYYAALENQERSPLYGQTDNNDGPDGSPTVKTDNAIKDGKNTNNDKQGNSPDNQKGDKNLDSPVRKNQEKNGSSGQKSENKSPLPGSGRCGSCATGQLEAWEDEPPQKGSSSGLSPLEGELIRRDVARQIREHNKNQGRVPGHWVRWAEERLRPQVDWKKQLAAAVRCAAAETTGATDYSYRRPSRRQAQLWKGSVIFPSMRCPVPSVAVVADTSASMSDQMLGRTLGEISGILKALGNQEGIRVLAVDRTVAFCRRVFRPEQIQLQGGGGTDMGAGLEAAAKLRPLPKLGIVITDGHTPWPDHPPRGMKVIVVLSGDGAAPAWAKAIHVTA